MLNQNGQDYLIKRINPTRQDVTVNKKKVTFFVIFWASNDVMFNCPVLGINNLFVPRAATQNAFQTSFMQAILNGTAYTVLGSESMGGTVGVTILLPDGAPATLPYSYSPFPSFFVVNVSSIATDYPIVLTSYYLFNRYPYIPIQVDRQQQAFDQLANVSNIFEFAKINQIFCHCSTVGTNIVRPFQFDLSKLSVDYFSKGRLDFANNNPYGFTDRDTFTVAEYPYQTAI